MGAVVAVGRIDRDAIFLVLQLLEEVEAALAADARLVKIARASEIGAGLLRTGERKELSERGLLAHHHQAEAGIARTGRNGDRAKHHGRKRDSGRFLHAFAHADGVTAGNMAKLVGDDELKLVDVVGAGDEA